VFFPLLTTLALGCKFCESGAPELWSRIMKKRIYVIIIKEAEMVVKERCFKRELFLTSIFNNWEDTVKKLLDNNGPEILRKKNERGLERI